MSRDDVNQHGRGSDPARPRVAFVHNRYRSAQPSGENTAVKHEIELLRDAGHEVHTYCRSSDEIAGFPLTAKAALPLRVVWSREDQQQLDSFLLEKSPDVIHVHNTFPLISPVVFRVAAAHNIPVVATLHNFRLACVNAQLFRDGRPCELCVGRGPWQGVVHRCYRGSFAASVPIASSIAFHRSTGTWRRGASRFISLSHFARSRLIASGLPDHRTDVLPNFVPGPAVQRSGPGDYFMFLGRITVEKGPDLLAAAWSNELGRLLFVGEGPMRAELQAALADRRDSVSFLGPQPYNRCMELLANARGLVVPSRWYEGSPMVIAEAYARGVPVIGPRLGAFPEFVEDGGSGLLFEPDSPASLRDCITALRDPDVALKLGAGARQVFDRTFTAEHHYRQLMDTYRRVRDDARG